MIETIKKESCIPVELDNARFDQALAQLFPEFSRNRLKSWIQTGEATLDGEQVKPKVKVTTDQAVKINATLSTPSTYAPEALPLDIVHEDDDILILNKAAGLVVHPGAGNQSSTLLNALLHHAECLHHVPRAGIVHRLDKDTTGLMIIAKTLSSHQTLITAMQEREIKREYQATVFGQFISGGTISAPIARHPTQRTHMAVVAQGKPAVTHYRINEKFPHHTHLNLQLETGRTHQIRVHLAHIKHPIIGDKNYAGRLRIPKGASETLLNALSTFPRQALHAYRLSLTHPGTGELMTFQADLPQDMQDLLSKLRYDAKESKR
jgi:23S rRNA pseudouridine1911/1915/1917 synthase